MYISNQSVLTNQETLINNAKLFEQNGESATTLTKKQKQNMQIVLSHTIPKRDKF